MRHVTLPPRPVTKRWSLRLALKRASQHRTGYTILGLCLAAMLLIGAYLPRQDTRPLRAHAAAEPRSWLKDSTLVTVYGRGFGTAPILGRLGMDRSFTDVAGQIRPHLQEIRANSGRRGIRPAIHLIYAMATPCVKGNTCLLYLDDLGVDLMKQYILPAQKLGWLVVLDDQLGRSNPFSEIERMIARGYLCYDNVEVAFDPEFRMSRSQTVPGVPVGSVSGGELNQAQRALGRYAATCHVQHEKLMLVHEWELGMVAHQDRLRSDVPYSRPVLVMDGYGVPGNKARTYTRLFGAFRDPGVTFGIKLFPPNPYEHAGHLDSPVLTWGQVFGHLSALADDGRLYYVSPPPEVIVLT